MNVNDCTSELEYVHKEKELRNLKFANIYKKSDRKKIDLLKMINKTQKRFSAGWEPVVTSTPVRLLTKTIIGDSDKSEIEKSNIQTSNLRCHNKINQSSKDINKNRKVRKRSMIHFDMTSSSDDENSTEINNHLEIKINHENITHRKLILKKIENNQNFSTKESVGVGSVVKNKNKRALILTKNYDKYETKRPLKNIIDSVSRSLGNCRKKNKDKEINGRKIKKNKENELCKAISHKKNHKDSKVLVSNNKSKKTILETFINSETSNKIISDCDTPINEWSKKKNSSHQLFSNTKEQELIDSLDLTSNNEEKFTKYHNFLTKESENTPEVVKDMLLEQDKIILSNKKKQNQTRRKSRSSQASKLYVKEFPKESAFNFSAYKQSNSIKNSDNSLCKDENKISSSDNSSNLKAQFSGNQNNISFSYLRKNSVRRQFKKGVNNSITTIKKTSASKKIKIPTKVNNIEEKVVNNNCSIKQEKCHRMAKKKNEKNFKALENKMDCITNGIEEKLNTEAKMDYQLCSITSDTFKHFDKLMNFEEEQQGCFTSDCKTLKNFRCGILKIISQAVLTDKTKFNNSYFGGVLLKGNLKMRISEKEVELKQFDMFCVPPLSEWSVENICKSESIFYFWSGRFRA